MPSAERIPDQKHAFEDAPAKLGCSVPGTDRFFALHSVRPSPPHLVAVVRRYAAWPTGSLYRSPLVMIAQMMRAVLLASATAATLVVRRASNCTSHGPAGAVALRMADHRQRANDQHLPQVAMTLLADAAQAVLTAARVLSRHQADPGS
jgi:hypothetical protein